MNYITPLYFIRAVHTPGHTSDHVVLWEEDTRALFSGDCILGETTAVFEDYVSYVASLRKILALKPKVIYPGHGPVVNDPCERIRMYIKHREQREAQYLEVLAKQSDFVSVEFITRAVYVVSHRHDRLPSFIPCHVLNCQSQDRHFPPFFHFFKPRCSPRIRTRIPLVWNCYD
jgi:glyoxylase-like metal-dependent hydrolase (beta-lactamase superfamily II)